MAKKPSPETYCDSVELDRKEALRQLSKLKVTSRKTKKLQSAFTEVLLPFLRAKGITIIDRPPTKTYFFPEEISDLVSAQLDNEMDDADAIFYPPDDLIIQFLQGNEVVDVANYFHEQIHSLGVVLYYEDARTGGEFTRVGHIYVFESPQRSFNRGEFLEEMVVDQLAAEATVEYFRQKNITITKEDVLLQAGGEHYRFLAIQFAILVRQGGEELERLLIQARFDNRLQRQLATALNRHFKPGAAQLFFSLDFDPAAIANAIWDLHLNPENR